MKKYTHPIMEIRKFTDVILTTDIQPLSEIYAAGSTNSVIIKSGGQRTTTAEIKDILKFR